MVEWDSLRGPGSTIGPVSVSVGVFDGVHIGHRRLLHSIVVPGGRTASLVVTFRQNPARVLRKAEYSGDILTLDQKLERMKSLGVQWVVLIDFSARFSRLPGEAFVERVRESLDVCKVAVSDNFHFGHRGRAGVAELKAMLASSPIEVEVVEPETWAGMVVSSSRIREAVVEARFKDVRRMLAADYALDLRAWAGKSGRTIERKDLSQVLPGMGRYRVAFSTSATRRPADATRGEICVGQDTLELQPARPDSELETAVFAERIH